MSEPERVALVTGAAGGLGRAICAGFSEAGWRVIGADLVEPDPALAVERFEQIDLGADGAVAALFERLPEARLDALVNNAAVQVNRALVDTSDAEWQRVIDVNLRAPFQAIREAHARLRAASGAIVNVSSVHAVATSANVAAYAITKGALVALTRSAAVELAADGVRCNAVLPGAIDTPMLRDGLDRRPHPDGAEGNLRSLAGRTPLGFVATPEQIAPTVLHLADSRLSPYTTGQALVLDGGATARLSTE